MLRRMRNFFGIFYHFKLGVKNILKTARIYPGCQNTSLKEKTFKIEIEVLQYIAEPGRVLIKWMMTSKFSSSSP
jgi:hypothetical protein